MNAPRVADADFMSHRAPLIDATFRIIATTATERSKGAVLINARDDALRAAIFSAPANDEYIEWPRIELLKLDTGGAEQCFSSGSIY